MPLFVIDPETGEEIEFSKYKKLEKKRKTATPSKAAAKTSVKREEAAFKNRMKKNDAAITKKDAYMTSVEREEAAFKNRMKKNDAQDAAMKSPRKQKSTTRKYKGGFMGKGSGRATRGY